MADYALHLYNASGAKQAVLTDFRALSYTRRVNAPGGVQFSLAGDHAILSSIADKWRVEVRRKFAGTWYSELWALFRDEAWSYGQNGSTFAAYCPGIMSMLGWRVVNYPASADDLSSFSSTSAETIMKTLVDYNAGSNATTGNGRKRAGTITGLTVEADAAGGNSVDWRCHGDNLLGTLQDLAKVAGGDFDLVASSATAYEFQFASGQLGTDRSATITFAIDLGNMGQPVYRITRSTERTVAAVWGAGNGAARGYVTRTGTNYNASTNNTEMFVDAKDIKQGDTAALNTRGDAKLDEAEAKETFSFQALQTIATTYGDEYDLGDLVLAINPFNGDSYTVQVKAVTVTLDQDGQESVDVEVAIQ